MMDVDYNTRKASAVEHISTEDFGSNLRVKKIIVSDVVTGPDTYATLFVDDTDTLYLLIESANKTMTLADVRSMVKSMNIKAKGYLIPRQAANYFEARGREIYSTVFPGRKISPASIAFYQTLSLYNPALIQVERLKGELRSYNVVAKHWRKEYDASFIEKRILSDG